MEKMENNIIYFVMHKILTNVKKKWKTKNKHKVKFKNLNIWIWIEFSFIPEYINKVTHYLNKQQKKPTEKQMFARPVYTLC